MNSSVTGSRWDEQAQLRIAWPKQRLSILIKPSPPQTTPPLSSCQPLRSPLFSSISLVSVSIVFPSFITHNYHPSIRLFAAQRAITARLPDPFPHRTHYISPSSFFFIFIHQFNPSSHPSSQIFTDCLLFPFQLITGFHGHSFTLNPGLSSRRRSDRVGWSTQREKKSYNVPFAFYLCASQQWMVYFVFIFHTLRHKQPTPRCWTP